MAAVLNGASGACSRSASLSSARVSRGPPCVSMPAVRSVWRQSAVILAAAGPFPQTSPTTTVWPSPLGEDVVKAAADIVAGAGGTEYCGKLQAGHFGKCGRQKACL